MRGWQDFLGTKKLIIRNKNKGLGQGFRNNKKIAQVLLIFLDCLSSADFS